MVGCADRPPPGDPFLCGCFCPGFRPGTSGPGPELAGTLGCGSFAVDLRLSWRAVSPNPVFLSLCAAQCPSRAAGAGPLLGRGRSQPEPDPFPGLLGDYAASSSPFPR